MSSIVVTKRTDKSFAMSVLHFFLRILSPLLSQFKEHPGGSPTLTPPSFVEKTCAVTERRVGDINLYDLHLKAGKKFDFTIKRRIYYFPGGAWQVPAGSAHWGLGVDMVEELEGTAVTIVSYPLAPNTPAPTTFPQLQALYSLLMRESADAGETVTLAGDSAGGNIVLALTIQEVHDHPEAYHPTTVFAISPSVELTRENPDIKKVERYDPILSHEAIVNSANAWAGDWDTRDPRLSPLYADLSVLVKAGIRVHGVTAGWDVLSPDAVKFRDACGEAGVKGQWLEWDKQMHCFPLNPFAGTNFALRETAESKDWILRVLREDGNDA
jgi:acetyl esterase/lipase